MRFWAMKELLEQALLQSIPLSGIFLEYVKKLYVQCNLSFNIPWSTPSQSVRGLLFWFITVPKFYLF